MKNYRLTSPTRITEQQWPEETVPVVFNFQYVVLEIEESVAGISRDDLMQKLHAVGIMDWQYFYPRCHDMEPYLAEMTPSFLPVTEETRSKTLVLPNGTGIDVNDVARVVENVMNSSSEIEPTL